MLFRSCEKSARAFKKLENEHGHDETLRRWINYCDAFQDKGQFASAEGFAKIFGQYEERSPGTDFCRGLRQFVAESEAIECSFTRGEVDHEPARIC